MVWIECLNIMVASWKIKNMCSSCGKYLGEQHDYNECTDCQGFKFYCELEEYRFADTF